MKPEMEDVGDLLSICLISGVFKDNESRIIDEALTFFFAGSQTSANATQNLILHIMKQPKYQTKILDEVNTVLVQPHLDELI